MKTMFLYSRYRNNSFQLKNRNNYSKMIKTGLIKKKIPSTSERDFVHTAFWYFLESYIKMWLFGRSKRTTSFIKMSYDKDMKKFDKASLEKYLCKDSDDFYLLNDKVEYGSLKNVVFYLYKQLERINPRGTVVEFGSGSGRNLFYLKSKYPDVKFIGLEISPASVKQSKEMARKFGLDVEFYECDITKELPIEKADIAFTSHVLEQLPRTFPKALENMRGIAKDVHLFEPICELYPKNMLGITERMRIRVLDILHGLTPYLKEKNYPYSYQRLKAGRNPLNETVYVELH